MQAKEMAYANRPNLAARIESQLVQAKAEVARLEELHSLLSSNPELTRAIELLGMGKGLY